MKKTNFVLGALAMIMASALVFTGCKPQPEPEVTYTVTFDSNGGSTVDAVTVTENATVTKPEDPTKDGYDFGGWFLGDSETAYDFEDVVTSDLTLKAAWSEKTYTIAYELNGGTNAETNPTSYKISSDDITLADPTGPEATPNFVAWHTTAKPEEGEWLNAVTGVAIAKGSSGNKTFYAEYTSKTTYTVTYMNGETELVVEKVVEGLKPTAADGVVDGYDFEGWFTNKELTEAYTPAEITANITVYGKFKEAPKVITYVVKFDLNGAAGSISNQTVKEGETAKIPSDPTRASYNFVGWTTVKDDASKTFSFSTPITADITLYALWSQDVYYKVTYYDGTKKLDEVSVKEGEKAAEPTVMPYKDGYVFKKWVTEDNGSTDFDFTGSINAVTSVYASWYEADKVKNLGNWGCSIGATNGTLKFKQQYAEANINGGNKFTAKSLKLVLESAPAAATIQFVIIDKNDKAFYYGIENAETTVELSGLDNEAYDVFAAPCSVKIQCCTTAATAESTLDVVVKEVTLISADDKETVASLSMPNWSGNVVADEYSGSATFTAQYGQTGTTDNVDLSQYCGYAVFLGSNLTTEDGINITAHYGETYKGKGIVGTSAIFMFDEIPASTADLSVFVQATKANDGTHEYEEGGVTKTAGNYVTPITASIKAIYLIKK